MIEVKEDEYFLNYKCNICGIKDKKVNINFLDNFSEKGTTICLCEDCLKKLKVEIENLLSKDV